MTKALPTMDDAALLAMAIKENLPPTVQGLREYVDNFRETLHNRQAEFDAWVERAVDREAALKEKIRDIRSLLDEDGLDMVLTSPESGLARLAMSASMAGTPGAREFVAKRVREKIEYYQGIEELMNIVGTRAHQYKVEKTQDALFKKIREVEEKAGGAAAGENAPIKSLERRYWDLVGVFQEELQNEMRGEDGKVGTTGGEV